MSFKAAWWTAKDILTGGKSSQKFHQEMNNFERIRKESDTSCFDPIIKPLQDYVQSVQDRNKNKSISILVYYTYSLKYHNADVTMEMFYSDEYKEDPFMATLEIKGLKGKEGDKIIKGFVKEYSINKNRLLISCFGGTLSIYNKVPVVACFFDYLGINGGTWTQNGKPEVTLFEVDDINL